MIMANVLNRIKLKLNDGNVMPALGLDVFLGNPIKLNPDKDLLNKEQVEAETAVGFALTQGYRLLDTAKIYGSERSVGRAIKESGIKREDIFVVTKLSEHGHGYDNCLKEFDGSLKKLDLDFVDLYLMHSSSGGKILETYDAMSKLKERGLVRSIGVSNFNIDLLEGLCKVGRPTPSVNQVELHVYMRRKQLVSYCRSNGIQLMAFAPLTKGKKLREPEIISIAEKYHKSAAQLLIRWCLQSGYVAIPKSTNKERIIENSQVFDWSISVEDMLKLDGLPEESCYDPTSSLYDIDSLKWNDHK